MRINLSLALYVFTPACLWTLATADPFPMSFAAILLILTGLATHE